MSPVDNHDRSAGVFHDPADLTDADDLTAECAAARAAIRRDFNEARRRAQAWQLEVLP